jgi:hypothetical protein
MRWTVSKLTAMDPGPDDHPHVEELNDVAS